MVKSYKNKKNEFFTLMRRSFLVSCRKKMEGKSKSQKLTLTFVQKAFFNVSFHDSFVGWRNAIRK